MGLNRLPFGLCGLPRLQEIVVPVATAKIAALYKKVKA
jgi:hypothetical protein